MNFMSEHFACQGSDCSMHFTIVHNGYGQKALKNLSVCDMFLSKGRCRRLYCMSFLQECNHANIEELNC